VITLREMHADELERVRDIDRSEIIRTGYRMESGRLLSMDVNWDDDGWQDGDGEYSFTEMIRDAEHYLELGGTALGAFDGDRLIGFAVYQPRLSSAMGQLAMLYVSDGHRRREIASRLLQKIRDLARGDGSKSLYVSATPTGSAVGFYLRQGFVPTDTPDAALFAKEPEDIHMVLEL